MAIDLEELKAAAMAAVEYPWSEVVEVAIYTDVVSKFEVEFLAQSNPATVLELIERLEAAEKRLAYRDEECVIITKKQLRVWLDDRDDGSIDWRGENEV